MKKLIRTVFIILITLFCSSCTKEPNETIDAIVEGTWTIDEMSYKNWEIKGCLETNFLSFYGKTLGGVPRTCDRCDSIVEWEFKTKYNLIYINRNDIRVVFETKNKFFKDTFNVSFLDDVINKSLRMSLDSKTASVLCVKALFPYTKLRELEKVADIEKVEFPKRVP